MKSLLRGGGLPAAVAVSLSIPSFPLLAADAVPETLPTVVVTATRTEVPVTESLAAITVIDRAAIERAQATDLAELLRFTAGVEIGRNGGSGTVTSVFIRGGESNHTLVLIDGVRVNPATAGGAALQNIAPEMIERIEIVKGPRSTLYGSDAISGVVNVITRKAQKAQADVQLRVGADQTREASAHLGYGDARKNLSVFAQTFDTDGFPICDGLDVDSGNQNSTVNAQGSIRLGERARMSARAWNSQGTVDYIGFCGFGGPSSQQYQNRVAAIDLDLDLLPQWTTTLSVTRTEDDIRQNQSDNFVRTLRPSAQWRNVVQLGDANRLSFGAGLARDEVTSESFPAPIDEDRDVKSAFVQQELGLGIFRAVLGASLDDYEDLDRQTNWNAELGLDVLSGTRLIAAAGTGFRAPDASDRFGFGGNPDLKPEKARNYEVGVRQQFGTHQWVDLRGFRSRVRNLISVECVTACTDDDFFNDGFRALNVDRYRNRGAELSWNYASKDWTANLTGTVQNPEDLSDGKLLPRRAKRSVGLRLARHFGEHFLALDALGNSQRANVYGGDTVLDGYGLVNLAGGLQLDRHWRLDARVENLLDKDYETVLGYNQPDTKTYLTLRYGF